MTENLSKLTIEALFQRGEVQVYDGLHFVYTGDDHGPGYANLRPLAKPENLDVLRELSYRLLMATLQVTGLDTEDVLVIGPATLGRQIAKEAVDLFNIIHPGLKPLRSAALIHCKEDKEKFLWEESVRSALIQQPPGRVMWVDDLMNKGSTWRRTKDLILDLFPNSIAAVATIANRSQETPESLGVPHFVSLCDISLDRFSPEVCPQCEAGKAIVTNLGHGATFQQKHPDYAGGFIEI